ncbi:MAG: TonB family protein [Phocaeicola sp.]
MKRNKVTGWVGTLLLHIAILLLLWWVGVSRPVPQEEGGVPVMLGNIELAQGNSTPFKMTEIDILEEIAAEMNHQTAESSDASSSVAEPGEEVLTQQEEETIAIPPKKEEIKKEEPKIEDEPKKVEPKKKEEAKKTEPEKKNPVKEVPKKVDPKPEVVKPKEPTEAEKRAEAERLEEAKRVAREKAAAEQAAKNIAGAFGKGNQMGSSGTATQGTGVQGSVTGNSSQGSSTGSGGVGDWDLAGRSIGSGGLPRPVYSVQEDGIVMVTITVDPSGRVVGTEINMRGTKTSSAALRKAAEEAARKARFNQVDGVNNQTGTITYYFKLK